MTEEITTNENTAEAAPTRVRRRRSADETKCTSETAKKSTKKTAPATDDKEKTNSSESVGASPNSETSSEIKRKRTVLKTAAKEEAGNEEDAQRQQPSAKQTPDQTELIAVAGIVDIMENYGFLRTSGYLPNPHDVYISNTVLRRYGLRHGDAVEGSIKENSGEDTNRAQKVKHRQPRYNPLQVVKSVNGMTPEEALKRPQFTKLTPLYPQERLLMEHSADSTASVSAKVTSRIIDLISPIGKGQRALIVAPPKAGKTIMMQQIANSISENNPEVHLMVVLVDERPEEVTDMERSVKGEVIASTFDRPPVDHTTVAELAIERAKRLVELGKDVVILLDSITRLARAYNFVAPVSGRILSGGVDASALYPPKKFLGAARNIEEGGSLTIIASALVETGSKMDEVIFEEFKGTGNLEIKLSRELAEKRIFPAVDVHSSGTRREEWLINAEELKIIYRLRRVLADIDKAEAIEMLIKRLKESKSNIEFLMQVQKNTQPAGGQIE
jgi:transcription termination factor Rho